MITEAEKEAIALATKAHYGQVRWNGEPYINHPLRVMESYLFKGWTAARVVAVLHDVIEDTDILLEDLESHSNIGEGGPFGRDIIEALDCVTRRKGESYRDFILRCKSNHIARLVKREDIEDNLIGLKPGSMRDKYELALMLLK